MTFLKTKRNKPRKGGWEGSVYKFGLELKQLYPSVERLLLNRDICRSRVLYIPKQANRWSLKFCPQISSIVASWLIYKLQKKLDGQVYFEVTQCCNLS